MKLYELTESYNNVWGLLNDDEADLETIETALVTLEDAIEEKAGNVAKFIKSMDAEIDVIKAEEKRLADRRKAVENKRDRVKKYIADQLQLMGIDKVKLPTVTIALQNNPPALQIQDESLIPASYLTVIPEQLMPDKAKIKDDLKSGVDIPGVVLTQGKSLRIR